MNKITLTRTRKSVVISTMISLLLLLSTLFLSTAILATRPPKPPNVVILFVDDLGRSDLGTYGNTTLRTPNIDKLANEGVQFNQWISASSICTPSRAALMTGRYAQRHGLTSSDWRFRVLNSPALPGGLPKTEVTIAEYLKENHGYKTHMSGKWHLGIGKDGEYLPHHHGFDHWYGMGCTNVLACDPNRKQYPTKTLLQFVIRKTPEMWITIFSAILFGYYLGPLRRQTLKCCGVRIGKRLDIVLTCTILLLACVWWYTGELTLINPLGCVLYRDGDIVQQPLTLYNLTQRVVGDATYFIREAALEQKPFFLYLPFVKVHTALFAMDDFKGKSKHGFYGDNVEEMDWGVGEIMKTLKEVGEDSNTLTYFSSDNGPFLERGLEGGSSEPLRGSKGQNWEGGIRMPGIVHWPSIIKDGGKKIEFAVSTMDILPTTLSIIDTIVGKKTIIQHPFDGQNLIQHIPGIHALVTGGELKSKTPHEWMYHYCGVDVHSVRWKGQYKVHYVTAVVEDGDQAILNGGRPGSCPADSICGCRGSNAKVHNPPLVFDVLNDPTETVPLDPTDYPKTGEDGVDFLSMVKNHMIQHQETIPWDDIPNQLQSMGRASLFPCCDKKGMDPWPALLHISSTSCRCDKDVPR